MGNQFSNNLKGKIVATNYIPFPLPRGIDATTTIAPTTIVPTTTCSPGVSINGFYPLFLNAECAIQAGNGSYHSHELNGAVYFMPEGIPFTHGTTLAPTTLAPTTLAPTTLAPTTLAPTTLAPTTIAPTTLAPTTLAPTTLAPTTIAPTTIAPTTIAPTTIAPTTIAPTTIAPGTPPNPPSNVVVSEVVSTTQTPTTTNPPATTPQPTTTSAPVPENWSPESLSLISWHDSSDICSIVDSSGIISKWRDKSGNDNSLTANDNPITGTSSENNLNVIDLDGSDSFQNLNFTIPSSGNLQVFIVCNVTNVDHGSDSILSMNSTSNDFQIDSGSTNWSGRILAENVGSQSTQRGISTITGMNIWNASFDYNSSEYILRLNGDQLNGTIRGNYTSQLATNMQLRIFSNRGTNRFPEGQVAEVIILEDVSESSRQKIEGYLSHKWGLETELNSSHPFKTSAPTETIDPINHPYSFKINNACNAGGIQFVESAVDVRISAPFDGTDYFEQQGEIVVISKEGSSPEEIEPTSSLPSDISSIVWNDYFPGSTQTIYNNDSSFYQRDDNDFGIIRPQSDSVWLNYKYYFHNGGTLLSSGNCEIFVDANCTTTLQPTTTIDPTIPTTTIDPTIPTTTSEPYAFPSSNIESYGGCMFEIPDSSGGGNPYGDRDNYYLFNFQLGLDIDWTNFARYKWEDDGSPTGEYWQYLSDYGIGNHELEISIYQGNGSGQNPNITNVINQTIDLGSATLGDYYVIDQNRGEYPNYFISGKTYAVQIPIDMNYDLQFFGSMTIRSKLDQTDPKFHSSTSFSQDLRTLESINASGLSIFCATSSTTPEFATTPFPTTTSTSTTFEPTTSTTSSTTSSTTTSDPNQTTTGDPASFSVGDFTQWLGLSAQIVADNGDGTYNINVNNSINYNINASRLGTDINGDPI